LKRLFSLCLFIASLISGFAGEAVAVDISTNEGIEQRLDHLFGEHQSYKKFFFQLKKAVLTHQRQQVSESIEYPITIYGDEQKYVIQSKAEFLTLYDSVFSANMLDVIRKQEFKDLFAKWSGVMIGQGEIWFHGRCSDPECKKVRIQIKSVYNPSFFTSAQGKKTFADFIKKEKSQLHQSLQTFTEPVLLWHTKNYIVRVDRMGKDNYRYAAWDITSDQSKQPNIILENGQWVADGSGGNHHYVFKKGPYQYICYVNLIGADLTPPGALEVIEKNKRILYQAVVRDLSL
jgi:hypothetical protein